MKSRSALCGKKDTKRMIGRRKIYIDKERCKESKRDEYVAESQTRMQTYAETGGQTHMQTCGRVDRQVDRQIVLLLVIGSKIDRQTDI